MTRIGWCPGGRTVADMLARYPGTRTVRIFVGANDPLPAWNGPILGPLGDVLPHASFKRWDLPALTAWLDGMPDRPLILTYAHEPEQGTDAGDPPLEVWRTRWAELVAALADHPRRGLVSLVPVYTRYWWQAHPSDLRWLFAVPGVDALGWDIYNNGTTYRTPDDLLSIPRDIAASTGLPYLIAELGAVRIPGDDDGAGRTAWMRDMVAAARADGALTACWFHKDEWDLTRDDSVAEQQTWRELIEQEASMTRVKSLGGHPIEQYSSPNVGGTMTDHKGPVLHIAEGTYRGTISWQLNPDQRYADGTTVTTSSSWIVGKNVGEWAQMCDSDRIAWCQRSGSRTRSSIELAGHAPDGPTPWQIEACAQILAWEHKTYGVPLAVADDPSEDGLGHHSMDRESMGEEWGHDSCPGAGVINAKSAIVTRAKQIINGEDDDDMDQPTFDKLLKGALTGSSTDAKAVQATIRALPWAYPVRPDASALAVLFGQSLPQLAAAVKGLGEAVARESSNPDEVRALLAELPQPAPVDVDGLAAALAERLKASLPQGAAITDEQLERVLRSALGSLDNPAS